MTLVFPATSFTTVGLTNALVEISNSLSKGDRVDAKQKIDKLEAHYRDFILELVKKEDTRSKANDFITEHLEFIKIILRISYSEA